MALVSKRVALVKEVALAGLQTPRACGARPLQGGNGRRAAFESMRREPAHFFRLKLNPLRVLPL